ncbi:MAG: ATP-binding protein [Candidatus Omnitrophica bacterium]|nr:ATP-binding protein [Candidatus Omnitrophota bacterium]
MRSLTETGAYISNRIGKAIADYDLIEDKDRILVAVSGGKDSLTMLKLLAERQKWAPIKYELIAIHIETDFLCDKGLRPKLKKIFKGLGVKYHFRKIKMVQPDRKASCFWCSWNRRKALFLAADRLKCAKIALGHHKDDIIETLLLNMFYKGEFAAMNPRQELFGGKITIIRPLCYVEEENTRRFAKEAKFPSQVCACPNSETSKRRKMKNIIKDLGRDCVSVKTNIFRSVSRVKEDYINLKNIQTKGGEIKWRKKSQR